MQIDFYSNFSKRENSTKQPTGIASLTLTGYLREPCSVMRPVIKIERLAADACPEAYVYAQIAKFGRWYFVEDWVWADGLWECHLKEDVLASFKTYINNTTAYVERSASQSNGAIMDRLYPTTTDFNTETVNLSSSWNGVAIDQGCFVLGVITKASTYPGTSLVGGAVTYYVMNATQMKSLLGYLLSDGFLDDAGFPTVMTSTQQLSHDTAKALVNPIQYFASCMWLPVPQSMLTDNTDRDIQIGYYDVGGNHAQGQYLTAVACSLTVTGQIPVHPQAATRGKYLNYSPYTRLLMSVQPFGSFPLDTSFCEIGSYLHCPVILDPISGKATMRVMLYPDSTHVGTGAVVYETSAMMGVPIQLAQMSPDFLGAFSNMIQAGVAIGSAVYGGGALAGDMAAIMQIPTIGNAIDHLMPQPITQGVNGSFLERTALLSPTLTAQHFIVVDDDNTECGRPLCSPVLLSTLTGYVKCGEATVDYPCFSSEKEIILNNLHRGMFLE